MTALTVISMVLFLLKGVLSAATKATLPGNIIDVVQGAITSLESVTGTPVTKGQLDSLEVTAQW